MTAVPTADDGPGTVTVGPRSPGDPATPSDSRWRQALRRGTLAYVASRLLVMAGATIAALDRTDAARAGASETFGAALAAVLRAWDGEWYLSVARNGYPTHVPAEIDSVGRWDEARVGFFPLFPAVIRAVDQVLPGGAQLAALVVTIVLGGVAVYLVGLLARCWYGPTVAGRAMVLVALAPGSVVLTFVYSEGLLIALAAGCLLALHRRFWWTAGLLAALATATRPNGVAVVAACAVAAIEAVRHRREWRALAAPILAPLGFVAFHAYLWLRTGEGLVWFRVQRLVWEEHLSFGASTAWQVRNFVTHPGHSREDFVATATVIAAIALVCFAWKMRLAWPALAYSGAVLVLMVLPNTVTARPRFLFTAFPLLIALAAWWPDDASAWSRRGWHVLVGASGLTLVVMTALYGGYELVP